MSEVNPDWSLPVGYPRPQGEIYCSVEKQRRVVELIGYELGLDLTPGEVWDSDELLVKLASLDECTLVRVYRAALSKNEESVRNVNQKSKTDLVRGLLRYYLFGTVWCNFLKYDKEQLEQEKKVVEAAIARSRR